MKKFIFVFLLLLLLNCSDSSSPPIDTCETPFVGDENQAAEIVLTAYQVDDSIADLSDGDDIPILGRISQGGFSTIMMPGVRIKNMNRCEFQLTAALRDETSQHIALDSRTINLVTTDGQTAESNSLSTFANVPVCPNNWSSMDIFDQTYLLEVTVEDKDGRTASANIHVVPRCVEAIATCHCICKQGYVLGEVCS